jgi:hypothetical protein
LEETKIRHLPVAERAPLRDINSSHWPQSFHSYLIALQCPHQLELSALESPIIIDWLLSRAVSLTYHDGAEEFNKINSTTITKRVSRLVTLDTSTPQFLAALQALAAALKLPTEGFDTDTLLKVMLFLEIRSFPIFAFIVCIDSYRACAMSSMPNSHLTHSLLPPVLRAPHCEPRMKKR